MLVTKSYNATREYFLISMQTFASIPGKITSSYYVQKVCCRKWKKLFFLALRVQSPENGQNSPSPWELCFWDWLWIWKYLSIPIRNHDNLGSVASNSDTAGKSHFQAENELFWLFWEKPITLPRFDVKKSNLWWINYAMAIALWHREQVLGIEIFSRRKMRISKFFPGKKK